MAIREEYSLFKQCSFNLYLSSIELANDHNKGWTIASQSSTDSEVIDSHLRTQRYSNLMS